MSRPASLQLPRPVTMNAAFGGPGRDFAAARCDYLFTTFSEMGDAGKHVADISERADKVGRDVGVYTVAHVVCRPTMEEAQAYYTRYAVDHGRPRRGRCPYGRQEGILAVARPACL